MKKLGKFVDFYSLRSCFWHFVDRRGLGNVFIIRRIQGFERKLEKGFFYKYNDSKKIQKFSNINNKAGAMILMLSFKRNRIRSPQNIANPKPKEEIDSRMSYLSPSNNPNAPKNSSTMMTNPNFSMLNLLNSCFMCGSMK